MPIPPERSVILLVDDDVKVRNLIRIMLKKEGYDILTGSDGYEALELSRAHVGTIDLLLTDVDMPRVNGISAYRQIVAERPSIKVLFMSGDKSSQFKFPEPWPFLAKPFHAEALRSKLNEILQEPAANHENPKVILVVDHDGGRRERTSNILTENGYVVLPAASVEEAEAISDSIVKIDLVVSGVVFPGHSGVHLGEYVEASEREISTLLISRFDRDLLRNDVPGFARQPEFLPNPFTAEALLTRVRRLLERH
jgi:DNA-binding NtrC family response regulator